MGRHVGQQPRLRIRSAGDQVKDAPEGPTPVQGRRRALDHLYTFQIERGRLKQAKRVRLGAEGRQPVRQDEGVSSRHASQLESGATEARRGGLDAHPGKFVQER